MKNIYFWFIALIAIVFSCTQEEIIEKVNSKDSKVEFGSYLHSTRAQLAFINNLQDDGFFVTGVYTGNNDMNNSFSPNFFKNEKVSYNTTSMEWEYSNTKFWPATSTEKISFFAVNDMNNNTMFTNTSGYPQFSYTQASSQKDQKDILVAVLANKTRPSVGDKVELPFYHALSAAYFAVKTDYTAGEITLNRITIDLTNLNHSGSFVFGSDYASSAWQFNGLKFTNSSDTIANQDILISTLSYSGIIVGSDDNYLLLMPQQIQANTVPVKFEFTIKTQPGNVVMPGYSVVSALPAITLEKGKLYEFRVLLKIQDILDNNYSVQFGNTTVSNWNQSTIEYPTN